MILNSHKMCYFLIFMLNHDYKYINIDLIYIYIKNTLIDKFQYIKFLNDMLNLL